MSMTNERRGRRRDLKLRCARKIGRVSEETNPSTAIAPILTAFVFDASTTTLHQTLAPNLIQRWRLSPSSDEKDRGLENQKSFIVESRLHLVTPYGVIKI